MVIAYAVQLSWHPKAIEVKPFLQTVSAESTGPHAEDRPKPVTGIKKREYEIGNECVPREPDIPCLHTNANMVKFTTFSAALYGSPCEIHKQISIPQIIITVIRCVLGKCC